MNNNAANKFLAITVIGPDRAGLIRDLTRIVADASGNIQESRMITLGSEFAVLMLISGNWHSVGIIREKLQKLQEDGEVTISIRDSAPKTGVVAAPYVIDVVSLDHEGIVHGLSKFFADRGLEISELNTRQYNAPHTGAPMFSVQMTVNIPSDIQISALREEFLDFCDNENLDAIMEPAAR